MLKSTQGSPLGMIQPGTKWLCEQHGKGRCEQRQTPVLLGLEVHENQNCHGDLSGLLGISRASAMSLGWLSFVGDLGL